MRYNIKIIAKWLQLLSMGLMFLLLSNQSAFALDMFTPVENDISLSILSQLFGSVFSSAGWEPNGTAMFLTTALDPFQYALKTFNWACMIFAGSLGAFALATGLMNTAHEGVLLGKELGASPYYWLRVPLALGLMLPLPMLSGYCMIQVVVGWCLIQSIGLSDSLWSGYMASNDDALSSKDSAKGLNAMYRMKAPSPELYRLAYKTFEGYTCLYGLTAIKMGQDFEEERSVLNSAQITKDSVTGDVKTQANLTNSTPVSVTNTDVDQRTVSGTVIPESQVIQNSLNQTKQQDLAARNSERSLYNTMVNRYIGTGKLNSAMIQIFGSPAIQNGVLNFGSLSNSNGDTTGICGNIDFNNSNYMNERTGKYAKDVQYAIAKYANSNAGANKTSASNEKSIAITKELTRISNSTNVSNNYKEDILKIYQNNYATYQEQIRQIALSYVDNVNRNVVYKQWDASSDSKPTTNVNTQENQDIIAKLKIDALARVEAVSRNFEDKVIDEIGTYYSKNLVKGSESSNFKRDSSIVNLSSKYGTDAANFISVIDIARNNAKQDGWITGGAWFMSIVRSMNRVSELLAITPNVTWASSLSSSPNLYEKFVGGVPGQSAANLLIKRYGLVEQYQNYTSNGDLRKMLNMKADINSASSSLAVLATGVNFDNMFEYQRHPIVLLAEMGQNLIRSSNTIFYMETYNKRWAQEVKKFKTEAAGNASNAKSNKEEKPIDIVDPYTQTNAMTSYFVGGIIGLGWMMAFYLPIMPLLIWIGAVLGWVVSTIEALFIAPLWIAMHLFPGGDKYTAKGSQGYNLLFGVLMRAPLMILGLIASLVVIPAFGTFVNYLFSLGFSLSFDSNSFDYGNDVNMQQFIYQLSLLLIYAVFMSSLIKKTFNLITIIPDQILRWVGGQAGNLSEYGNMAGAEVEGKMQGLTGSGFNAVANKAKESATENAHQFAESQKEAIMSGGRVSTPYGNTFDSTDFNSRGELNTITVPDKASFVDANAFGPQHNGLKSSPNINLMPTGQSFTPDQVSKYNRANDNACTIAEYGGLNSQDTQEFASTVATVAATNPPVGNALEQIATNGSMQAAGSVETGRMVKDVSRYLSGGSIGLGASRLSAFNNQYGNAAAMAAANSANQLATSSVSSGSGVLSSEAISNAITDTMSNTATNAIFSDANYNVTPTGVPSVSGGSASGSSVYGSNNVNVSSSNVAPDINLSQNNQPSDKSF